MNREKQYFKYCMGLIEQADARMAGFIEDLRESEISADTFEISCGNLRSQRDSEIARIISRAVERQLADSYVNELWESAGEGNYGGTVDF